MVEESKNFGTEEFGSPFNDTRRADRVPLPSEVVGIGPARHAPKERVVRKMGDNGTGRQGAIGVNEVPMSKDFRGMNQESNHPSSYRGMGEGPTKDQSANYHGIGTPAPVPAAVQPQGAPPPLPPPPDATVASLSAGAGMPSQAVLSVVSSIVAGLLQQFVTRSEVDGMLSGIPPQIRTMGSAVMVSTGRFLQLPGDGAQTAIWGELDPPEGGIVRGSKVLYEVPVLREYNSDGALVDVGSETGGAGTTLQGTWGWLRAHG